VIVITTTTGCLGRVSDVLATLQFYDRVMTIKIVEMERQPPHQRRHHSREAASTAGGGVAQPWPVHCHLRRLLAGNTQPRRRAASVPVSRINTSDCV